LKHRVNFAKNKVIRFDGDPCMGMYEGTKFSEKKIAHKIRLSTSEIKSDRQLFCTLAHEYVHAWQMENNQDLGHDTKIFHRCIIAWKVKIGAKAPISYQVFSALIKSTIFIKAILFALVSDSVSDSVKPNASPIKSA